MSSGPATDLWPARVGGGAVRLGAWLLVVCGVSRTSTTLSEDWRRARAEPGSPDAALAEAAAAQAKVDLKDAIARRMTAAAEQIESSVKAAERAVRDQAISVSVAVAADVLKRQMTAAQANASIDASIAQVAAKLH